MGKPIKKKINKKKYDLEDAEGEIRGLKNELKSLTDRVDRYGYKNEVRFEKIEEKLSTRHTNTNKIPDVFKEAFDRQMRKTMQEPESKPTEKIFCKDCKHRIKDWNLPPELHKCRASIDSEDINKVTGKKFVKYKYCDNVNAKLNCEKYEKRGPTFLEKANRRLGNIAIDDPILATIITVAILSFLMLMIAVSIKEPEELENKNKSSIEAPETAP